MYQFRLPLNLQLFAEGDEGGGAATPEFTPEQFTELKKSYDKLQSEFTKVTQKNSEMTKQHEQVKPWLDWDQTLEQLSQQTGINAKALAGSQMDGLIKSLAEGKAPTVTQMVQLDKAIDKADNKGDEKTVKKLEELQNIVYEREYEKTVSTFEKQAQEEGIEFNQKEFEEFAWDFLSDLGVGDDDEFTDTQLKRAYEAFEAKKLKELSKRGNIPPLSTSGGAGLPDRGGKTEKVGGIRGAAQKAMQILK